MRIAVITNAYPPNARGGAGEVAASLVGLWEHSGHDVRVWVSSSAWLARNPLWRLFGHLVRDRRAFSGLNEVLAWKPQIVVTHNLTGIGWRTGNACQAKGVRWIHVLHDVQLFEPSGQLAEDRITSWQRFWSWYRRGLFGAPDVIVSPTRWLLDAHARRGWSFTNTRVMPNPAPTVSTDRKAGEGTDAWLFVGRLSADKGADLLLDVARLRADEPFVCIGDGPLRPSLEKEKNVYCLGQRSRDEVQSWMKNGFALLMPSRLQENQPTVIIEACANGLPVITSKNGGIPETLGGAGIIAEMDVQAWMVACDQMKFEHRAWTDRAVKRAGYFDRELGRKEWEELFTSLK